MSKKKFGSLLIALVFLLATLMPAGAFAAEKVEVLTMPNVNDDTIVELGTVFMQSTAGKLRGGDTATISLPEDFKFLRSENVNDVMDRSSITVSGAVYGVSDWNTITIDDTTWLETKVGYFKKGSDYKITEGPYTSPGLDYYPNVVYLVMSNHVAKSIKVGNPETNYFEFPVKYQGDVSGFFYDDVDGDGKHQLRTGLHVDKLDDNEIKITVKGDDAPAYFKDPDAGKETFLYVHSGLVYVDSGFDGVIYATIKAPSTSGISSGSIPVGRVSSGAVDVEVTNAPTFSDKDTVTIRVEEDVPGALEDEKESIQFTLPNGFAWTSVESVKVYWGKAGGYDSNEALANFLKDKLVVDDDELTLNLPAGFASTDAIAFEIKVGIEVEDETDAELGDITAKISGKSDYNQSEIFVGKYGQFDCSITVEKPAEIVAGMLEQELPDIIIEESIEASLIEGRTLILTLPSNFKWNKIDDDSDSGVGLEFAGFPGKDGQTAKWTVKGKSSDAAELVLSGMEVAVEPGTTGDLVVEVGGTAGFSDELTLAKVIAPVTITASATPSLAIGKANQPIGDLTITESVAGALSEDDLVLELPTGFKWASYKDIEVTAGDLKLDEGGITTGNNDRNLVIPVDNDSTIASTITLTNLAVTVDRTAPEGEMVVKVKGNAVNEVNNPVEVKDAYGTAVGAYLQVDGKDCCDNDDYKLFPETGTAAKTVAATVGTPAPSNQKLVTAITLGDNGSYISDGRIMVQMRDAAGALGVAPQNILWDNSSKTATLIKGDRIAQITVGDPQVKLNGTALPTDKGAEIKDGRTFVSLSMAGIALGATAEWDNETKTATITVN